MTIQAFVPFKSMHLRPAFWGLERDFKDVVEQIESTWSGYSTNTYEIHETDKAYLMSIDMPGVSKNDLEIQAEAKVLNIKAVRRNPFDQDPKDASDIKESTAQRTISHTVKIPDAVDREKIQARCENGVLYLAFPKVEHVRAKKIDVLDTADHSEWGTYLNSSEVKDV